ncbi:MAG: hypothetical protein ACLTZY_07065 [Alistipes indistinctus]
MTKFSGAKVIKKKFPANFLSKNLPFREIQTVIAGRKNLNARVAEE